MTTRAIYKLSLMANHLGRIRSNTGQELSFRNIRRIDRLHTTMRRRDMVRCVGDAFSAGRDGRYAWTAPEPGGVVRKFQWERLKEDTVANRTGAALGL